MVNKKKRSQLTSKEVRTLIRKGKWNTPTAGVAMGYAQANLVVLPEKYAFDFLLFCQRNPKPCPLLEVLEPGRYLTDFLSSGADIRTDVPKYHVYREGRLEATVKEIKGLICSSVIYLTRNWLLFNRNVFRAIPTIAFISLSLYPLFLNLS